MLEILNSTFINLADYSAKQHDEFAGIKVSHLLVYYDQDGDGTPEDPEEFLSTLTEAERAEHIELIADLFETVKIALGTNVTIATELNAIVTEYQEATRIPLGFSVKEDEKAEKWMEFRKAGLNLKFENIPSEITNTSNFPSNQSTLDKVFYDRAIQLHDRIKTLIDASDDSEELINGGIPFFDMAGSTVNDGGLTEINENENLLLLLDNKQVLNGSSEYGLRSTFGYHFLLVDSISEKTSAKFDEAKDNNKDYQFTEGEVVFSAYNDKDQISASQIEYYVKGNKLEEGILMPSAVKSAFTKYYEPVLALYNNQFTKSALFFDYIGDVKFTNASNNEVLVVLKGINTKQFNGYITNNANYDALYQDWFKDLKVA